MYGLDSTPAQTSPNTHTYVLGKVEGEKEKRGAGRRELIQEEREKTCCLAWELPVHRYTVPVVR